VLEQNEPALDNTSDFPEYIRTSHTSLFSPGIPPPSPSSSLIRRSSTTDNRKNSLIPRPDSYSSPGYSTSSLRRSSTLDRTPSQDILRAGSISRNSLNQDGNSSWSERPNHYSLRSGGSTHDAPNYFRRSRETPNYSSESEDTPNYSRYSSILDDKHDWGFRTLRRRNSKNYPSDDIRF